jgi:hypothetical protein
MDGHGRSQQSNKAIRNALHLHAEDDEQQDRGRFAPGIRRGAIIAAQELGILVDVTVVARRGGLGLTARRGRSMQDDVHLLLYWTFACSICSADLVCSDSTTPKILSQGLRRSKYFSRPI